MSYRDSKTALLAITRLATSQGGYFTARQASVAGYKAPHLTYHVAAGNFERVGRGLYRIQMLPLAEHDDLVRLWLWSRGRDDHPRAIVSHQTALALHDLAEFIPTTIHLTVPQNFRTRPRAGCVLHRASLASGDAQWIDSVPVTTPLRTLSDLATPGSMPAEQFTTALDTALRRGLIQRTDASRLRLRCAASRHSGEAKEPR